MSERDVYHTPDDRVLLRTEDVYQTEAEDDVTAYSDKLLAIVADFKNSGEPEGVNARAMVGKSKRGEVACRLAARIDPETGVIEAAGFKARGCLAMTACASAACLMIENKGIEEALEVGVEEIRACVDGVPSGKVNALHFAACAIRALVGDFLIRDGASLAQLEEALPCDEGSISCIMAEHCSLRASRLEIRMEEEEAAHAAAEAEALAQACDAVRARSAQGKLAMRADWEQLTPAHLMLDEFEEALLSLVDANATEAPVPDAIPVSVDAHKASAYANRGVGIPSAFGAAASDERPSMPKTKRAIPQVEESDDEELRVPEGYELREVDGELALVQVTDVAASPVRQPDASGLKRMEGAACVYLYDGTQMKPEFARWAYLAAEDDPVATFAYCVREDSRVYPRPMPASSLTNHPFDMTPAEVEGIWEAVQELPEMSDLARIEASNGDAYFYSVDHLSEEHARSLAEWESVERLMNV